MRFRKHFHTQLKRFKRFARKHPAPLILAVLLLVIIGGLAMLQTRTSIDTAAYRPLLEVIAKGESNSNYNAYYGNGDNKDLRLVEMSLQEVLDWQSSYVEQGSPSSAAGRYQIIRPTLVSIIEENKLDKTLRFDEVLQDMMAIHLMERRGAEEFVENKLSGEEFAHELSKEWAALPRVIGDGPEQSYYAGDGLNASRVEIKTVLEAINNFKLLAKS